MHKVKIGDRVVGEGAPVFIIAEAGVNHNGDLETAKRLIEVAAAAGADAIKFQTFQPDKMVSRSAGKAEYQKRGAGENETQLEMLQRLQLTEGAHWILHDDCKTQGIMFLSSAFDDESVELLERVGVPAYKVPSGEITNLPLLETIAKLGKPMILSTGMATMDEIAEALSALGWPHAQNLILLHCNSSYPTPVDEVNLLAMKTLRQTYLLPVGFSDHTLGWEVALAAVALGAHVIEKHFTLSHDAPGPDHHISLEPEELRKMIRQIRNIERALGNKEKKPTASELETQRVARKSLVAACDIAAGTILRPEQLLAKRPGIGIPPKYIDRIVEHRAKVNIAKDTVLTWELVE
jgi:N-acetylneuraminate synthase/N,N'-diacetyllegionaminate synthase